jgi:sterol desaturase/sphingolipid hydroxylase (fatty acid hydroxylase superfamily)
MSAQAYQLLFNDLLLVMACFRKEILWQCATIGVMLALVMFPGYTSILAMLRDVLGPDYGTDQVIFTIMVNSTHTFMYVTVAGTFGLFDAYDLFPEYKLARKPHMAHKRSLIVKALSEQAFAQLVLNPLAAYFFFPALVACGLQPLSAALPAAAAMFQTFAVAHIVNSVGFYAAHRLLHCSLLYARIHKQHHEFAGTIGMAAEYAHPIEQVFANMLPSLAGVIFFGGTHPLVFCIWLALRLQHTYEHHSGYCFLGTWMDTMGLVHPHDAIHHDYHHAVNRGNFGSQDHLDWLFGTQDHFMAAGGYEAYLAKKNTHKQK